MSTYFFILSNKCDLFFIPLNILDYGDRLYYIFYWLLKYGFFYANNVFPVQNVGLRYLLFVGVFRKGLGVFYNDFFNDF
jgi:hypothetical protein